MLKDRPSNPTVLANIKACLTDLGKTVSRRRKEGATGIEVGCIKDDIAMLEQVLNYGSYGGKVPWPVNKTSLAVFKKHDIEHMIHAPWKPRHRPD